MKNSKVKIVDVAKNAGVSPATVSRVLSNNDKVNKKSVEAVLKSIEELNYKPNAIARQLRNQKTNAILVIVPDIRNPFFGPIIRGIEQEAKKSHYDIFIVDAQQDEKTEMGFISALAERQIDGIISLSALIPFETIQELSQGFPIVVASQSYDNSPVPNIGIDNVKASEDITNYLISLGHKEIGFITTSPNISLYRDRYSGHVKALADNGIKVDSDKLYYAERNSIKSGYEAAIALFEKNRTLTAVYAAGDRLALGVIKAAKEKGMSVPEDLSVAGFDDIEYASFSIPSLTTVRQPTKELGSGAMKMLKSLIDGKELNNSRIILTHSIIARDSTAILKKK